MQKKSFKYPDTDATKYVIKQLHAKGVHLKDIAQIAYSYEKDYIPELTLKEAKHAVKTIVHKREVANTAMVALNLDELASWGALDEPLQSIVEADAGVFGVDELLASGIANLYGQIGITNFGYSDKDKTGIIAKLDTTPGKVNTFIDDIVGAIAAAAAAKITHDHA